MSDKKPLKLKFVKNPKGSQASLVRDQNPTEKPEQDDRARIRDRFITLLNPDLGARCEKALYVLILEKTGKDFPDKGFKRDYLVSAHNLLENLDLKSPVGNDYLRPRVLNNTISPENLVKMSDQELYPPKWERIKDRRLEEIEAENAQKTTTTDLYKCGKCGKSETTFYQLQTRSMDEPTTSFINCVNCGNRWKD
jgi:transcription elongation factor S-II